MGIMATINEIANNMSAKLTEAAARHGLVEFYDSETGERVSPVKPAVPVEFKLKERTPLIMGLDDLPAAPRFVTPPARSVTRQRRPRITPPRPKLRW